MIYLKRCVEALPCSAIFTQTDKSCDFLFSSLDGGGRVVRWYLVNFQCRGVLLICIIVGQGSTALAVGAGGGCLDIFSLSVVSLFFLPLSGRRPDID